MSTVVLVSCASKKLPHRAKAKDLYVSPLFKLSLAFARSLRPDNIFILSAKHGLVSLDQELDPYERTLNTMSLKELEVWSEAVGRQLRRNRVDFARDEAIFLAGERYRRHLAPLFQRARVPLRGLGIGKQLQYLKRNTSHAGPLR